MVRAPTRGMSDAAAEKTEKAPAAGGGGNKKILIIVLAVNMLLMGGLGYVVVAGRNQPAAPPAKAAAKEHGGAEGEAEAEEGHDDKDKGEEHEEEEEGEKKTKHAGKFGPLLEVGTFVANLQVPPDQTGRYAKVSLSVEAYNEDAKLRIEGALVPIRSEALMMFSNAQPEDVIGQDKIMALAEELAKRANKLVGKKTVKRVFFSELVVQ